MPKRITKFGFFFFLFSFFFLTFIPTSLGSVQNPVITTDVLSVSYGNFVDTTTEDGSGKIKFAVGGEDLISFENLGVYSVNEETNTILYRARVKFGEEINAWTETIYRDIFPYTDIDHITEIPYLVIHVWTHVIGIPTQTSKPTYHCKYREIDYGTQEVQPYGSNILYNPTQNIERAGSYKPHDYDGYLPVTVKIDPGMKFDGEITLAGETFTVPKLTSDIINIKLSDIRGGEVGSYEDRYLDISGVDEGTAKLSAVDEGVTLSAGNVINWVNSHDIGFKSATNISKEAQSTIQPAIRSLRCIGETYFPVSEKGYNEQTFRLPVHIQPEVTRTSQYVDITRVGLKYWKDTGNLEIRWGPTVDRYRRDVSIHVYNQFVHYELEIEADMFMTVQFEGEISESFLEDPNLYISDMLWDTSFMGDIDVEHGLTIEPLLNWIWIIAFIILVGISLVIVYKVVKKRQERPQINVYTQR